ncbi:hypothetical protein MLD38_001830 [Melastoma candidum]|uniref:Uncharacterized protein n=1 Tax=Melastoma candidum TaxID=119954 RepID=A0ACB9SEL6_9MYRT|nr:hypothetical protein MLD38_001830 [Melastoma candidum]
MSPSFVDALSNNYYDKTCPNFEHPIRKVVKKAMANENIVPAALLRMHFHDCFIRGCDGSVLLNSTVKNTAEKDGLPDISLHAIHNFATNSEVDPSLSPSFPAKLHSTCPIHNTVKNAGSTLDSTTTIFDNAYLQMILQGKSIFSSDQAFLSNLRTRALVNKFATSQAEFFKAFATSMVKMGSLTGGQEVRLNCRVVRDVLFARKKHLIVKGVVIYSVECCNNFEFFVVL